MECARLRIKDLDFARGQITVRDGKGGKDRVTMLPDKVRGPLQQHIERVRRLHTRDLARGLGRASRDDTTFTNRSCSAPSRMPSGMPGSPSRLLVTHSGIHSPRTCWSPVRTSGRSRSFWATRTSLRP